MFGGIAFLVDGAMCIGVDEDDLIVRCAKDETEALLAKEGVRELGGGLRFSSERLSCPGPFGRLPSEVARCGRAPGERDVIPLRLVPQQRQEAQ